MAKESKTYTELVEDMQAAGTYQPWYRLQIRDTADTIDTISRYQRLINKEPVGEEYKTGGIDTKKTAHPLIQAVATLKNTLAKQLGYLGLNYSSQKKAESSINTQKAEDDPMLQYMNNINNINGNEQGQ